MYTFQTHIGRARQADSAFVIMKEDSLRTVQQLQSAEQDQSDAVTSICETGIVVDPAMRQRKLEAQKSRKRSAMDVLTKYVSSSNKNVALASLNTYNHKTSGDLTFKDSKKVWYER